MAVTFYDQKCSQQAGKAHNFLLAGSAFLAILGHISQAGPVSGCVGHYLSWLWFSNPDTSSQPWNAVGHI